MGQDPCQTCESLKELYRLKLNHSLLAARSSSSWSRNGFAGWDNDVLVLKEEALGALRTLMRHATECQGINRKEAA